MTTAICIASGASLTLEDVLFVKGKGKIYAVNDVYKLAPFANVLYSCDFTWWEYHKGVPDFMGEKHTISKQASDEFGLILNPYDPKQKWGKEIIATGNNSGFQAMNLAYLHGASRIILLGYDMGYHIKKTHFFGDHPPHLQRNPAFHTWIQAFNDAKPHIDIPIINATRMSALGCFDKQGLEEIKW